MNHPTCSALALVEHVHKKVKVTKPALEPVSAPIDNRFDSYFTLTTKNNKEKKSQLQETSIEICTEKF